MEIVDPVERRAPVEGADRHVEPSRGVAAREQHLSRRIGEGPGHPYVDAVEEEGLLVRGVGCYRELTSGGQIDPRHRFGPAPVACVGSLQDQPPVEVDGVGLCYGAVVAEIELQLCGPGRIEAERKRDGCRRARGQGHPHPAGLVLVGLPEPVLLYEDIEVHLGAVLGGGIRRRLEACDAAAGLTAPGEPVRVHGIPPVPLEHRPAGARNPPLQGAADEPDPVASVENTVSAVQHLDVYGGESVLVLRIEGEHLPRTAEQGEAGGLNTLHVASRGDEIRACDLVPSRPADRDARPGKTPERALRPRAPEPVERHVERAYEPCQAGGRGGGAGRGPAPGNVDGDPRCGGFSGFAEPGIDVQCGEAESGQGQHTGQLDVYGGTGQGWSLDLHRTEPGALEGRRTLRSLGKGRRMSPFEDGVLQDGFRSGGDGDVHPHGGYHRFPGLAEDAHPLEIDLGFRSHCSRGRRSAGAEQQTAAGGIHGDEIHRNGCRCCRSRQEQEENSSHRATPSRFPSRRRRPGGRGQLPLTIPRTPRSVSEPASPSKRRR
ncbi:MAG: hypothetical protein BWX47_00993 [candidate division Hyd24-12 bacterium ADurb.Bin004]|nr:MAG: hypothetical protein BWX47_00993 [candidate division Hyd24-12 bacterium ADurb.Bin004]